MKPVLITSTEVFTETFRRRRQELGLTHLDVDDIVGITDGHTSKIEAPTKPYGKRPFNMTFVADWLLQGVGLALVIMDRDEALELTERDTVHRVHSRQSREDGSTLAKRYSWVVRHQPTRFRQSGSV